ncbi:MAG TPA: ribbon-helix-helix protein, CopG family [Candidatus Acidoferrum sp.]|nr:ribbon-helix-helix protein, CopG family [Candidatus Acidoferrum sp.]
MTRKIQSPFELEEEDSAALNDKARQLQRNKSSIIRQLIREHLQEI